MNTDKKFLDKNGLLYIWTSVLKPKFEGKVDKENGKGLSTNDYTNTDKTKLAGIATGANKTTIVNALNNTSTTSALSAAQGKELKDKLDALEGSMSDLGYGDMMKATYDTNGDGVVDNASKLGGQEPSYYAKADGTNIIATFTQASTRTNIASKDALPTILSKIMKFFADLKTVAFTGSYSDLTNKPTIPTVTNDLTDALKTNYDAAYTHSQSAHAPSNAQANVIESVKVNGTALSVSGKAVNITVPTTVASLTDAGNYALKSDIANVYRVKGSVDTVSNLPNTATVGDVYNVTATGMNYVYTDQNIWDALGMTLEIQAIENTEIDEIFATA